MQWEPKYILVCTVHTHTPTHTHSFICGMNKMPHTRRKKNNATVGPETEFQQIDY